MTKEQIKFYLENAEDIIDEIDNKTQESQELEDLLENITAENIEEGYKVLSQIYPDIIEKYVLSIDALKVVIAIESENRSDREEILGRNEANQLLRDVVDIFGEEAYEYLKCDSSIFEISDIDGILLEGSPQYSEFYANVLNRKCREAITLEDFTNILLSTKPEYLNQGLIESFLPDKNISSDNVKQFIENAPSQIVTGSAIKKLVNHLDYIAMNDESILENIPEELFDEEFSKSIIDKAWDKKKVFSMVPEKSKSIDVWEYAISQDDVIVYQLPKEKIDENMTDEQYSLWCEKITIDYIRKHPTDIRNFFYQIDDLRKTPEVCLEATRLLEENKYDVVDFLRTIPEEHRTREIYELLLDKSEMIIKEIPNETFEENVTQEEYSSWLDTIISKKIIEMDDLSNIASYILDEKMTEKVWNTLLDNEEKNKGNIKFDLGLVPIYNRTISMCERALRDFGDYAIKDIPSIDRKVDKVDNQKRREEYEKWISSFTEKDKQEYRQWYESKVIEIIEKGVNVFTDRFDENDKWGRIPTEAISVNMINKFLELRGPNDLKIIPAPNDLTTYNEQYEDIVLYAISMLPEKNYINSSGPYQAMLESSDLLEVIPEEYRTDKVILEAIKKHPKYLDYADFESDNFEELLQIGYKNKLNSIGRDSLTEKEIELIIKFAKNNATLFSTLNLDILRPDIVNCIGESSIEKIARYSDVQDTVIEISNDIDALTTFGFALKNLKQDNLFIEPLIEKLSRTIGAEGKYEYNRETERSVWKSREFLKLASQRIRDNVDNPLSDEEKTIISYLALNPKEANKIKSYEEIENYVENKNVELDEIINSQDVTLIDAKNAYLERIVGMNYESVLELIKKYGNDPEQLLEKYDRKQLDTYKEKSEKESLEIIIKLKSLIEEKDLSKIRQAYKEAVEKEDKTKSFERYRQAPMLDNTLRRAYGRDITQTLDEHNKENNIESVEHTEDGKEYVVRKMNGPFNRMISVMNAYRKSDAEEEGDMFDRWNTSEMAGNHALCYSYIDESNPGTAMLEDKKGVIISISGFDAEAVTAAAPYDLCSDSRTNTTKTYRQQRFYTTPNLPNQTRGMYSEVDIEIQDVSEGVTEYKKIQPTSIVCFEEIDEDSINAAIELSRKLGRTIPIELIDRRELASQVKTEIDGLFEQFKNGESLQPELVEEIITKFNNVRNAHMSSSLADELLGERSGEENPDALFNKVHLNDMLSECVEIARQKIEKGQVQEGLETIEQIKEFIKTEREKNVLMPTMYEKQIMAGISLDIDYNIDEIQRTYGSHETSINLRNESVEVLQENQDLNSPTFEIVYSKTTYMPEQLSFSELKENIDMSEIQSVAQEIHEKGYYSENKIYSEEHIVRVAMFSKAIANIEGIDEKTKELLGEAVKYYSSGRRLDIPEEQHQEYSAKIAGKELGGRYSQEDVRIVQASIELQNFYKTEQREKQRKEKIAELCNKYGIDTSDGKRIDTIATCISDADALDKARFVTKANNRPGKVFDFQELKTNTARRLVKVSHCIQDKLSTEHLKHMKKVAHIDFEEEKGTIMEKFFTQKIMGTEHRITDESIIDSPIVQEAYFREKFAEIEEPVKIGRELSQEQKQVEVSRKKEQSVLDSAEEAINENTRTGKVNEQSQMMKAKQQERMNLNIEKESNDLGLDDE